MAWTVVIDGRFVE